MNIADFKKQQLPQFNGFVWILLNHKIWKIANYNKTAIVSYIEEENKWLAQVNTSEKDFSSEDQAKTWCESHF